MAYRQQESGPIQGEDFVRRQALRDEEPGELLTAGRRLGAGRGERRGQDPRGPHDTDKQMCWE